MSNNVLERLAQMSTPDIKKANWNRSFTSVGTNDFGFLKVKFCEEIIAGSHVKLDFRSAYSSNPTISPVLSKAKVRVTAFWVPISLYVPALRDNIRVKPGESDFSFPSFNFNYADIYSQWNYAVSQYNDNQLGNVSVSQATENDLNYFFQANYGDDMPYCARGSLMADIGMYSGDYQPILKIKSYPTDVVEEGLSLFGRNAIPFLGYLDFYRTYIMNSQFDTTPVRVKPFIPAYDYTVKLALGGNVVTVHQDASPAEDVLISRSEFDRLFTDIRYLGMSYPQGDGSFDITPILSDAFDIYPYPIKEVSNKAVYFNSSSQERLDEFVSYNKPLFISHNHYFELRDTYAGDYFTAFLSNENVEYERSTAKVVAGDGGVITMEQIYAAERVQNYVRRSIFKNNGYGDFVESQYGVTPPTNLTHPMFLGSISTDLYWNDVVSQTQSGSDNTIESNLNLGSRAGLGSGRMVTGSLRGNHDKPFIEFTAKEPGYLMLVESIVPEISYYRSYHPQFDKLTLESLYFPAFDKDGYQDKAFSVLCESPVETLSTPIRSVSSFYDLSYAQEPAYFEYMSAYNKMTGQISEEGVYRHWVFNRQSYDIVLDDLSTNLFIYKQTTPYVDPEQFNVIFANVNGLDNFQTFYDFDFKVYQPLSHRFLSFD